MYFWWPGLWKDVTLYVASCDGCRKYRTPSRDPRICTLPSKPWEAVAADLFEFHGDVYLIVVDYMSSWIEAVRLSGQTASVVVSAMKSLFCRLGVPERVRTDNGPCFSAREFRNFLGSIVSRWRVAAPITLSRTGRLNEL